MTNTGDPGTSFSVSAGPKLSPGHPRPRLSQNSDSGRATILHSVHGLALGANTPHQVHSAYTRESACRRSQPAVQQGTWSVRCPVSSRAAPAPPVGASPRAPPAESGPSVALPQPAPPRPLALCNRLPRRPESAAPRAQARPRGHCREPLRERRRGPRRSLQNRRPRHGRRRPRGRGGCGARWQLGRRWRRAFVGSSR